MSVSHTLHAARLFYFLYFAVMGLVLPYFPVYLNALHMDAFTIGVMVALISASRILAPPLFSYGLEKYQQHTAAILALASLIAALSLMLLDYTAFYLPAFATLLLLFSLLWAGVLPPADSLSIRLADQHQTFYARIRLWGSIGFVASTVWAGIGLDGDAIRLLPWVMAGLMVALAISAMAFRGTATVTTQHEQISPPPHSPALRRLMLAGLFMQCSHGAYYSFFSLHLMQLGFQGEWIGVFWVIGVAAEIILMAWGGKWIQQCSLAWCLQTCFLLAALRWLGIAYSEAWWWLVIWQCLHAATFAAFHISSVTAVNRMVDPARQASAQAWLAAIGFGLGSMLGALLAGWLVQMMDIRAALLASALIALVGAYVSRPQTVEG